MRLRPFSATVIATILVAPSPVLAQPCPPAGKGVQVFSDHTIGFTGNLEVDTDGASASYSPGDHGYSYIADGVDRFENGRRISCIQHQAMCRQDWAAAEKADFGPGSPQFCSFAIAVDPWADGRPIKTCPSGKIVGDGLGRPQLGAPYPAVSGGTVRPYNSETSLHQKVGGAVKPLDLGAVPALVVPLKRSDLLGAVAWARYGQHVSYAIVADAGPSFHEGSLALHQALRADENRQPIGPIPAAQRCSEVERSVHPPFVVRSSPADQCPGRSPHGPAEIRASIGIGSGVHVLILADVKAPMSGGALNVDPTPDTLAGLARAAGYTDEKLAGMDRCLR